MARAVPLEDVRQARRVFRQVLQRHGAVLHERDRLSLLLHRHHDVEAGGADVGDRRLQLRVEDVDHAAPFRPALAPAEAEIADQLVQARELPQVLAVIVLAELDEEHGFRVAAHELLKRRTEHRNVPGEADHRTVDQLDRDGVEPDDVLGGLHGLVEAAEMAGADRAPSRQRRELQRDPRGEGERSFRADQDVGEVEIVAAGHERIEVVAADPALDLGVPRLDLVGFAQPDQEKVAREAAERRGGRNLREVGARGSEMRGAAVGEHRVDRQHVVAHRAVAQRAGAAGIVGGHAADGRARGGRDVDREPQAMGFERAVEVVEDQARLDHAAAAGNVQLDDAGQMLGAIDHKGSVDRLPALRRAAAARQHADPLGARDRDRAFRRRDVARDDDAHRHHLVMRCIGGIAAAGEAVEQHFAGDFGVEPSLQAGHQRDRHADFP